MSSDRINDLLPFALSLSKGKHLLPFALSLSKGKHLLPFALSLSKGKQQAPSFRSWFDRLTTNGTAVFNRLSASH
jgi:hypothetical protein